MASLEYRLSYTLNSSDQKPVTPKPLQQTGSVTLIQRFGSALNLNVHYHMLFHGVYAEDDGKQRFHRVKAPTYDELNTPLTPSAIASLGLHGKRGILERDAENTWLTLEEGEDDTLTFNYMVLRLRIALPSAPARAQSLHPANLARGEDKADSNSQ